VSSKFRVAIREIFDLKELPTQQDKVNEGILKEQVKRILTDLQTELEREKVLP
jgi:hypothetical protein